MEIKRYHNNDNIIQQEEISAHGLNIQLKEFNIAVDEEYNDENNLLLNLVKSILSVESKYVLYKDKNTGETKKHLERVFAYELYRQWSNRIQIVYNNKLIINGEIGKEPRLFDRLRSTGQKYPDLVLHQSHENCDYQGVVCEIKTSDLTPSSFKEDIEKLCCFVCGNDEHHRFNFGAFILIGERMNHILDIMDEIENHVFKATAKERMNRIICLAYNHGYLETVRLDWLINQNNRNILRTPK